MSKSSRTPKRKPAIARKRPASSAVQPAPVPAPRPSGTGRFDRLQSQVDILLLGGLWLSPEP